jgi:hypothetical protein
MSPARARSTLRAVTLFFLLATPGCDPRPGDFVYHREIDPLTDQVEFEQIYATGAESVSSRQWGTVRIRCRGRELSSWFSINTRIDPSRPTTIRLRLNGGTPFEPEGWNPVEHRGQFTVWFQGRTRAELFAHLDTTRTMIVGIYGQNPWGEADRIAVRIPTRGFGRASRKLSCFPRPDAGR